MMFLFLVFKDVKINVDFICVFGIGKVYLIGFNFLLFFILIGRKFFFFKNLNLVFIWERGRVIFFIGFFLRELLFVKMDLNFWVDKILRRSFVVVFEFW